MYNSQTKGTDAWFAMDEFVGASKSLDSATAEFEGAADNACAVIEQLTDDAEEKDEEIERLEVELKALHEKLNTDDAAEFIRVLRNVQVYVADHIEVLEKKYGKTMDTPVTSEKA